MDRPTSRRSLIPLLLLALPALPGAGCGRGDAPQPELAGYWEPERSAPLLAATMRLRLAPDVEHLDGPERAAVEKLLAVGELFQRLYERQSHAEALEAHARLLALHESSDGSERTSNLLDLYRLFKGPVATTLENAREPFLPVAPEAAGRNVYPAGMTREELDEFLAANPAKRARILDVRSVVRRAEPEQLAADLATLDTHPALDTLHPALRPRLESLAAEPAAAAFYSVPYSVAYAAELLAAHDLLHEAADAVEAIDGQFAGYLRLRARDLLTNDYEGGDAAWVSGEFGRLNAQIGSYETYDDELYGVKSFFGLSLLVRDEVASEQLVRALGGLQAIEDSLPYAGSKRVRDAIPVGVYDVVADFGQSRGTNTATILPNESEHARKYGRTILIRANILRHPEIFDDNLATLRAALAPAHAADLTSEGNFQRTLWHEIGHYLGPDRTADGRELNAALQQYSDLLEELKSDLVSLHAASALHRAGHLDDVALRSIYASGVLRTLQKVEPRRSQPYQTMQLMQMNWFLDGGLLAVRDGRLEVNYAVYHNVVAAMLEEVLGLQWDGDPARAALFVDRWATWDDALHGELARLIRAANDTRFRLVHYAALGD